MFKKMVGLYVVKSQMHNCSRYDDNGQVYYGSCINTKMAAHPVNYYKDGRINSEPNLAQVSLHLVYKWNTEGAVLDLHKRL